MDLLATNGWQIGGLIFRRNEFLQSDFFSRSSQFRQLHLPSRPIFRVILKSQMLTNGCKRRVALCALPTGEKEVLPKSEGFLEKEFKFKPTFSDYVKVMESVRNDRSKQPISDTSTGRRSSRNSGPDEQKDERKKRLARSRGTPSEMEGMHKTRRLVAYKKVKELKDASVTEKHRKTDNAEPRAGGWSVVQKLVEKGKLVSSGRHSGNTPAKVKVRTVQKSHGLQKVTNRLHLERGGRIKGESNQNQDATRTKNIKEFKNKYSRKNFNDTHSVNTTEESDYHKFQYPLNANIKKLPRNSLKETHNDRIQERETHASGKLENENITRGKIAHVNKAERRAGKNFSSTDRLDFYSATAEKINDEHNEAVRRKAYESPTKGRNSKVSQSGVLQNDSKVNQLTRPGSFSRRDAQRFGMPTTKVSFRNDVSRQSKSQGYFGVNKDVPEGQNYGSQAGGTSRNDTRSDKVIERDIDDFELEDRAAFRTFEVFTDVRNRPRVLRMEMEERIRNLAKWLHATDVNMPEWQFSRMIHGAKIKFTDHSILRVIQILGEFGNWRRVLQVVEWLRSRERFKSYKSKYIYTAALDVLGKAKRPMEALNIFYAMRLEKSSYPDIAAYHCIAVTLGQAGRMKELFDVIDCMRSKPKKKFTDLDQKCDMQLEPDLIVYNAVLNACIQQKQWEGAFWVLQQLKQQGIKPTSTTYGLVMEVMLACGKFDLVHEFFRKVEKTSIPSTLSYKVLVNAFWREGKIDEAVLAVQDMERRGVVGSASVYYDLARCLCTAGRCQEALMQIDKICKVAKKPLVVTYTGLIQACLDSGSIQNGAYIFNEMHKFCSPNIVTCNIMLKSYLEHGLYEEAKCLFHNMLDASHSINSKADLRRIAVPDKFTFNTMLESSIAAENWDDFESVYLQMLRSGYHFDKKRHLRMIMDASRAGKVNLLDATWDHLIHSDRVLPPPIIKERFSLKLKEEDYVTAVSCLGFQQHDDLHAFSKESWLNFLKSSAENFRDDTIFRLANEIESLVKKSDQQKQCQPIYQNLLNACTEFLGYAATYSSSIKGWTHMI